MVGPFFWIRGKLIAFPDKLEDGVDTGIGVIDGQAEETIRASFRIG